MRKVILILLALGVIGAGIGYYMYNKPVASLEKKKADVEATSDEIIAAYEADEKAADGVYPVSYTHLDVYKRQVHPRRHTTLYA